jgi:hypothetical protein
MLKNKNFEGLLHWIPPIKYRLGTLDGTVTMVDMDLCRRIIDRDRVMMTVTNSSSSTKFIEEIYSVYILLAN